MDTYTQERRNKFINLVASIQPIIRKLLKDGTMRVADGEGWISANALIEMGNALEAKAAEQGIFVKM